MQIKGLINNILANSYDDDTVSSIELYINKQRIVILPIFDNIDVRILTNKLLNGKVKTSLNVRKFDNEYYLFDCEFWDNIKIIGADI